MLRVEGALPAHTPPARLNRKDFMDSDRTDSAALQIARAFVSARDRAVPLVDFPGPLPRDMPYAYTVQEAAIGLRQDTVAGWKVGLVPPPEQAALGATRLAGPIFSSTVFRADAAVRLPAITGGFAAIEVELVAAVGRDAPPEKTDWTAAEAATMVGAWHLGVEFAASPLATINDLGAAVVVCDFGNNSGLVVGARIEAADPAQLVCRTTIDGKQVGQASAAGLPGGPLESLRFLLGHLAARRRPLRTGDWVSTGAITGVHRVIPGQHAGAELLGRERIDVSIVPARAPSA
jgi:2-keto-4-pentenoate hydratase